MKLKAVSPNTLRKKSYVRIRQQKFSLAGLEHRHRYRQKTCNHGEFSVKRTSDDQSVCVGCWVFQRSSCSFIDSIKLAISGMNYNFLRHHFSMSAWGHRRAMTAYRSCTLALTCRTGTLLMENYTNENFLYRQRWASTSKRLLFLKTVRDFQ